MDRSSIKEKVDPIIRQYLNMTDGAEINEDMKFLDDLGADSLDLIEIVMDIESEFDIEIPDSVFDTDDTSITVGKLLSVVEQQIG